MAMFQDDGRSANLQHLESFKLETCDQIQSFILSELPWEIRDLIYEYVFADYEDMKNAYDMDTVYRRPGLYGPRKSDTALLRTCQAVYFEAWYKPWTNAQHVFFLGHKDRCPSKTTSINQATSAAALVASVHPDAPRWRKEFASIQVFAQLWALESGDQLQSILDIPHFYPRRVTITLRHTDLWWWEEDHHIFIGSDWVESCRFPNSVKSIVVQVECPERKGKQLEWIMKSMVDSWQFLRGDRTIMAPESDVHFENWMSTSTWNGKRWVRDEDEDKPGEINLRVGTMTFVPHGLMLDDDNREIRTLEVPAYLFRRITGGWISIDTHELQLADIPLTTPASETVERYKLYRQRLSQRPNRGLLSRISNIRRRISEL